MVMAKDTMKIYEKPQIVRVNHPIYSKHGLATGNAVPVMAQIEGKAVSQLIQQFGSPLFVFSEKQMVEKFLTARKAFEGRYPKVTFGWSYKTNYLKALCRIFHREGAVAEVVSDFEYQRARSLNVPGPQVIFNGPYKPYEALKTAVHDRARIHLDSLDELSDLEAISRETGIRPQVAIRINLGIDGQTPWSRFGFNYETGQALQAVERIVKGGVVTLEGLHTHIGTFILDPNAYGIAVKKLIEFAKQISQTLGVKINYLDLGGGFPSLNHLKGLYQPPEIAVPGINEFAEKITSVLKQEWVHTELPELVLETGRHLIDEAGYLITSAVSSKLLPDSRRAYVLDAGVNLLYTSTWYKPQIHLAEAAEGVPTASTLVGPLCMNIDVVCESLMLPRIKRGSALILNPVGAYNVTQWMQFIQYRPAVALIRMDGRVELIRKREDLEYMDQCETLPSDLI